MLYEEEEEEMINQLTSFYTCIHSRDLECSRTSAMGKLQRQEPLAYSHWGRA